MSEIEHCTAKMLAEGARALDLWADESLREEIDGTRMAELVWKAMVAHSACRGAVDENEKLRGLLTLWLNVAPADTRETVMGPNGKTLGELTADAFGGQ